jgi:hypothetical protein
MQVCASQLLTVSARRLSASWAGPGLVFLICSLNCISCWSSFFICSSIRVPRASRLAPACSRVGGGSFFLGAPNIRRMFADGGLRGAGRSLWAEFGHRAQHSQQQMEATGAGRERLVLQAQ